MPDVTVDNQESVTLFTLHTENAREWITENVELEPYQWMGQNAFAVEYRYAVELVSGMNEEGLLVE